ncbi:MAG: pentapeptide repeat-containing protein [Candidatus Nitrohelix vancouverensis]|uniref:Pentapeptide repeat-containing protein n=1 Tax=Candidatus Nitrohelix vancouverensis TaxID=2705534 RepID=A0A7T0C2W2_9BACT|nr:MAG: pentapeptide repeat-containing protein [Candidatus Nitrohelix vancouverensis]
MAHAEQLEILKKGAEAWNQWREENAETIPDLSQADLRGAKLQQANLKNANLSQAKLQFVNFSKANLESANLSKAKLQEANLQGAQAKNVDLSGASLLEANLYDANLENANLQGAQFNEDVQFDRANLRGANLISATGLTSSQITQAFSNKDTRLPEYLEEEMDDDFLLQF